MWSNTCESNLLVENAGSYIVLGLVKFDHIADGSLDCVVFFLTVVSLLQPTAPTFNDLISNDRGYSFERNCVLRRWESETLKKIINHKVDKVN